MSEYPPLQREGGSHSQRRWALQTMGCFQTTVYPKQRAPEEGGGPEWVGLVEKYKQRSQPQAERAVEGAIASEA